jgi:hypothetical protein
VPEPVQVPEPIPEPVQVPEPIPEPVQEPIQVPEPVQAPEPVSSPLVEVTFPQTCIDEITLDDEKEPIQEDVDPSMYLDGTKIIHDSGVVYTNDSPSKFVSTVDSLIQTCLNVVIQSTIQNNLPLTHASRIIYIWFFTVTAGFNWVSKEFKIKGTHDSWNWNTRYPLQNSKDIQTWIVHLLAYIMPQFVPTFQSDSLLQNERTVMKRSHEEQNIEWMRVSNEGNWKGWSVHWKGWFEYRQADNNLSASSPPTMDKLPNKQLFLNTFMQQNPETFFQPQKWTPLIVNSKQYHYTTYEWESVKSSSLNAEEEKRIVESVRSLFPTEEKRTAEIAELVSLTANLTHEQKVLAEFWLQTKVPLPSFFMLLWSSYVSNITTKDTLDAFFASGLELSIQMFEASRLLWKSKRTYVQATPIQDVRRIYNTETVTSWNAEKIQGSAWKPYYDPVYLSPACPDFPSEQSALSQIFAGVLTRWYGESIDDFLPQTIPFISNDCYPFGTFVVHKGTSLIQPGEVPSKDTFLSWSSWKNMATSCGIATRYAGIHTTSSHNAGQELANAMIHILYAKWFGD